MKKRITLGVFLVLFFTSSAVSRAQTSTVPEVKTYEELRHAISQARAESRTRVEKAVEQERVREAWEIGKLIDVHVLQHKERADYGAKVLKRLSSDLGMSRTELSYMLQFARAYPNFRTSEELTWGHYESLLALNDAKEREEVEALASKEKWPVQKIREEVKKRKSARRETPAPEEEIPLTAQPGKPGTYKIILAKAGPYAGKLAVDLGFSNYLNLTDVVTDASQFKEGDIVAFSQDSKSSEQEAMPEALYIYRAYVHKVLDGDTIQAVVDLGFGFVTTQTLRFRGIDAPELPTRAGAEAKEFVESVIASRRERPLEADSTTLSGGKQPILIKTFKSDKYDRYLVDVFVPRTREKQQETRDLVYLNKELLEKGHAVRVHE